MCALVSAVRSDSPRTCDDDAHGGAHLQHGGVSLLASLVADFTPNSGHVKLLRCMACDSGSAIQPEFAPIGYLDLV